MSACVKRVGCKMNGYVKKIIKNINKKCRISSNGILLCCVFLDK